MVRGRYAVINTATAGDNTIVAAKGARIKVLAYLLVVDSAVTITWKSGSTPVSGPMRLEAGIAAAPGSEIPWFITGSQEALVLHLSDNVQVSGHLTYITEN